MDRAINFHKYHGTGNDFIIIDDRENLFPGSEHSLVKQMCHRRFGIGADGLILLRAHDELDFTMVYYNSDGKESSMCGNGGRCAVQFAKDIGIQKQDYIFQAIDGPHKATIGNGLVNLKMKDVGAVNKIVDDFVLDTGSPHYVIFTEKVSELDIIEAGRKVRYSDQYKKEGINVNFVETLNDGHIHVRTYERGVEAETYSCGTGVVAAAIATFLHGGPKGNTSFTVQTKGGELKVRFATGINGYVDIWLSGPAAFVFKGVYTIYQ